MQLLFADQLGPHFDLGGEIFLPEVLSQFKKRSYHRQKAHLILYAIRARARDPRVNLVSIDSYRDLIGSKDISRLINPTSYPMRSLVHLLDAEVLPSRGFCSTEAEFAGFAATRKQLKLETFYRQQRSRLGILMEGEVPVGGQWNFDADNRLPPPKEGLRLPEPLWPLEDELDLEVRQTLDKLESSGVKFLGSDGPRRFASDREQALNALADFVTNRLDLFGPYEDAVDSSDTWMAHSLLSVPMNLGLLDPIEVVRAAEDAYLKGTARLESVEGFIRQIIGWRDYVWHLYWHFGEDYVSRNSLDANVKLPQEWRDMNASEIQARCLSETLEGVRIDGWAHHIPRLMILGNIALQRGFNPTEMNEWFIDAFVDGTPWVMPANVIGMSLYADGGQMSTKPYAGGGAYIDRMTNYCSGCKFNPKKRVGEDACPVTAGYWHFLERNKDNLKGNFRLRNAYAGLARLSDLEELLAQESRRKSL